MNQQLNQIVQVRREGAVAIVTMNSSEGQNIFSLKMGVALIDVLSHLFNEDQGTRAIVLTGADGNFCSGGDFSEITTDSSPSLIEKRERIAVGCRVFRTIHTGNKPVIAAIEGQCMGTGMSLAAACDLAIGTSGTRYACSFVEEGLLPATGALWSLPLKLGAGKARELMLSGATLDGSEAARIGLINQIVAPGKAVETAIEQAARIAEYPPVTLALLKGCLVNGMETLEAALRLELDLNPVTRQTLDHTEAVKAFIEKRKPSFSGH